MLSLRLTVSRVSRQNFSGTNAPAHNEQFGASGGVGSTDTEQVTSSVALVRALPMPPPAAKPQGVAGNVGRLRTGQFRNSTADCTQTENNEGTVEF